MGKPVLFAGTRPYGRAENISALYDAYKGEKEYITVKGENNHPLITSGKFSVLVIDDFPSKKPDVCIMIWHGIQGGKYIGFDQPKPYLNDSRKNAMDYIITPGHGSVPMWERCCHFPKERILPLGMPRTDEYIGKKKGDGHTGFADKRMYLYAPTYRWYPEPLPFQISYEWLDEQLMDNEVLVVKAHMVGGKILDRQYKHIVEIPSNEPSAKYLYDCDVCITDYSSIMFDAYLLNKPVVLLEKGKGYVEYRGMYLDYPKQYCSRYATNEEELLKLMRSAKKLKKADRECVNLVADMCDGHSCERICELIEEKNGGR